MLLTTMQAADRLGVSDAHVRRLLIDGLVRGQKLGRDWLIPASEVDRYARERRPVGRPAAEH